MLSAGEHTVDIRYGFLSGGARLEWLWEGPGVDLTFVPPDVLRPLDASRAHQRRRFAMRLLMV